MNGALALLLGVGWGSLAGTPLAMWARRTSVVHRLPASTAQLDDVPRRGSRLAGARSLVARAALPLTHVLSARSARRAQGRLDAQIARELPVVVDLLAVAVGAGCTPYLAVEVSERWAPPTCAAHLAAVRRACNLGVAFADALDDLGETSTSYAPVVDALLASDRYGAPVGAALARVAVEQRATVRRDAEARARTVPVRLLFPLVFLVLPAFGLLTVVPALLAGFART